MNLSSGVEYVCRDDLDLFSQPGLPGLATQIAAGRHLRVLATEVTAEAVRVMSREDDYPAWMQIADADKLTPATTIYQPVAVDASQITALLPQVVAFARQAMTTAEVYLWGGTIGPNYDCSGLMQAAFKSVGVWLPRDSYQQEAFTQPIAVEELIPGDLIFFGKPEKTDHVAIHLGDLYYLHSSGIEMGRNGMGIDRLSADAEDPISRGYFRKFRRCGRVVSSYLSSG
jgi:cell wall-associated NlpC family hydrolase